MDCGFCYFVKLDSQYLIPMYKHSLSTVIRKISFLVMNYVSNHLFLSVCPSSDRGNGGEEPTV